MTDAEWLAFANAKAIEMYQLGASPEAIYAGVLAAMLAELAEAARREERLAAGRKRVLDAIREGARHADQP